MKGPKDSLIKTKIVSVNKGIKKKRKPTGGKALARLMQFALKRNLPVTIAKKTLRKLTPTKEKPIGTTLATLDADKPVDGKNGAKDYAQALSDSTHEFIAHAPTLVEVTPPRSRTRRMAAPATSQWRFLGPSSITNGQTYGNSRVICSGRVAAIAIDPSDSNHILVGSAGGGVWESRDRGAKWEPRTDFMPSLKTGAIAFDPSDPAIVYCGTGEGNDYTGLGQGILQSKNGGTSWALLSKDDFVGKDFFDLIVDQLDGKHMLAATNEGIYQSTDRGQSWLLRLFDNCWDLAMTSTDGMDHEILAACTNGLYQSLDKGLTFKKLALPLATGTFTRLAVAISKSNPAKAYAFGLKDGATKASLWCRTKIDGVWKGIGLPVGLDVSQAWYDWFLEVSPENEDQIYVGAIDAYRGTKLNTKWTWAPITTKRGDDIHPDQHCLTIDPANTDHIYIGNDGGIFFSPNRGKDWQSLNAGLGITEIEFLTQDLIDSDWLLAGTQDNGSIRYTGNQQWEQVADGDGGDCGVNQKTPDICYHTYFGIGMDRSTKKGAKGSWKWIGPDIDFTDGDVFHLLLHSSFFFRFYVG